MTLYFTISSEGIECNLLSWSVDLGNLSLKTQLWRHGLDLEARR